MISSKVVSLVPKFANRSRVLLSMLIVVFFITDIYSIIPISNLYVHHSW